MAATTVDEQISISLCRHRSFGSVLPRISSWIFHRIVVGYLEAILRLNLRPGDKHTRTQSGKRRCCEGVHQMLVDEPTESLVEGGRKISGHSVAFVYLEQILVLWCKRTGV